MPSSWAPLVLFAGCSTEVTGSAEAAPDRAFLYLLLVLLIGGTFGASFAFWRFLQDVRREREELQAERRQEAMVQSQQPLVELEAGDRVAVKRPTPDRVSKSDKPAFTPPPPPPAPPESLRSIRPEDARLRQSVQQASSFQAPNLRNHRPMRIKTHTTTDDEFEALEFKPAAVLFEGAAIATTNGKPLVAGVLPFLEALNAANVPMGFVLYDQTRHLSPLLGRYGPVIQGPPPLSPLLVQAARVLSIPIDQCAAIVGGAASIRFAHDVECMTIGFSAQGPALALSQADLVVRQLLPSWVQPDGRFSMD